VFEPAREPGTNGGHCNKGRKPSCRQTGGQTRVRLTEHPHVFRARREITPAITAATVASPTIATAEYLTARRITRGRRGSRPS